jgi:beta-lactamase class D
MNVTMNRRTVLSAAAVGLGCRYLPSASARKPDREDEDGVALFRNAGVDGAFVLLDRNRGWTDIVYPARADQGFLPASTFKIANTVIGLETGVIPDERFSLKWDGVDRKEVSAWNRDHDLTSAFRNSVVWFYQEIARRIGEGRMRQWLARLDYGNRSVDGGIDQFWLKGGLRITPRQQVMFLHRLMSGQLPVKTRTRRIVRAIMSTAAEDGVTVRWKTGLTEQGSWKVGWMVGLVERKGLSHVFSTLVLGPSAQSWGESPVYRARLALPFQLLARSGAIPGTFKVPG